MSNDTTRERILIAASAVFTEKGYDNTTVRDICTAADANVAAVNYHFGDKQKLYYQVLKLWMNEMIEYSDRSRGITPESAIEEKLRAYIRAELSIVCTYDDPSQERLRRVRMILKEITADERDPELFDCHKEVEENLLFPVIREFIGDASEENLKQAYVAATGMLTHYFIMVIHDPKEGLESEEKLEYVTDFLTTFVLGGLQALKGKINA